MSKHEEADLILKLYDLRREETMRKAREWYFLNFNPQSVEDVKSALFSEQSNYLRMVWTYWDMAAALVNHGAISRELFNDTNSEHIGVFAKMELVLEDARGALGPHLLANLEKLVDATPEGRAKAKNMRERFKDTQAKIAARRSQATATA